MIEFYEDRFKQGDNTVDIDSLMTEEEQKRVSYYVEKYETLKRQMEDRMSGDSGWEAIEKLYRGKRNDKPIYSDNNREINIMLPQIEGQIAAITNQNISGAYRGVGYSDELFAKTAGRVGDFIINQNPTRNILKNFARSYSKFGTSVVTVGWQEDKFSNMGLPIFETPKISKIFVDDKVSDVCLNLEDADFIIHEVGRKSLSWARDKYGDDIADAIELGNNSDDFGEESENRESFTYLRVWTKNNKNRNLQLLEISQNGILLEESDGSSPYYKHVHNRFPFFFSGMYKDESDSYYFGDGYVLLPFQEYINKLLDVILRAVMFSSQGRTFADVTAYLNPDDFSKNDPAVPIFVRDINKIRVERGNGVNESVFALLNLMFTKIQEATRFSALMTGNSTGEVLTATQAGIQAQQGISGIDDKKKDISRTFGACLSYAIGLCMQFWTSATALRVADNDDDFEWIDVREFKNIPEMIPASSQFQNDYKKANNTSEAPRFMQLTKDEEVATGEFDDEGNEITRTESKGVTKELDLDIVVNIGEGMPSNKMALYNIIVQLSQLPLFDEQTGQTRPLVGFRQFADMVRDYFGIDVGEIEKGKTPATQDLIEQRNQMAGELQGMQTDKIGRGINPLNINPDIPGANMNGTQISQRSMT